MQHISHDEVADQAIADLMNCLQDGSISVSSQSHIQLTNAVNTYLLEQGFTVEQLPDLWAGEMQLVSS